MAAAQPASTRSASRGPTRPPAGGRGAAVVGGLSDEELARRSADGDRACFGELVQRYGDRVLGLTLSRVRDRADAEEAAQDTFLRAWRGIKTFDPERRFSAWLLTIAHRQAIEVLRRRKRDREGLPRAAAEMSADAAAGHRDPELREESVDAPQRLGGRAWAAAKESLKPEAYEALWLRYAEGCAPQEIARVMGKTSVWVRVTLHRARARVAEALGDVGAIGVVAGDGSPERGEA